MQKKEHLLSLIISYITAKNTICQSFLFSAKDFFSDKIFVKNSCTFSIFLKVFVRNSMVFSIPIGTHWFYHMHFLSFLPFFYSIFIHFCHIALYQKKKRCFYCIIQNTFSLCFLVHHSRIKTMSVRSPAWEARFWVHQ